jgi:hypothetical protein
MAEEKYRFPLRLTPEVQHMMKEAMPHDNSQSQNEYIEKAIRFYSGYLMTKDSTEYLTPTLVESLRGTLDSFGAHINRSLFRLCVENAIMENILAAVWRCGTMNSEASRAVYRGGQAHQRPPLLRGQPPLPAGRGYGLSHAAAHLYLTIPQGRRWKRAASFVSRQVHRHTPRRRSRAGRERQAPGYGEAERAHRKSRP